MKFRLAAMAIIGIVGYTVYGLIAYFVDRSQLGGFLALNISMVTGTLGLVLRDMKFPNDPLPPPAPHHGTATPATPAGPVTPQP
jgi:hypothetical protein